MSSNKEIASFALKATATTYSIMEYLRKFIVYKYGTLDAYLDQNPGVITRQQLSLILNCRSNPKLETLLIIFASLGIKLGLNVKYNDINFSLDSENALSSIYGDTIDGDEKGNSPNHSKEAEKHQKAQEKAEKEAQRQWHKNIRLFKPEPNPEDYPSGYIPTQLMHETMMANAPALGKCTSVRGLFHYYLQKVCGSITDYHYICYDLGFPWLFMPREYDVRLFGAPVPEPEYTLHFIHNLRPEVKGTTEGGRYMDDGEIRWFYRHRYLPLKERVLEGLKKGIEYPNQTWAPEWPRSEWVSKNWTPNFKTPTGLDWDGDPTYGWDVETFEIGVIPLDRPIFWEDYLADVKRAQDAEELARGPLGLYPGEGMLEPAPDMDEGDVWDNLTEEEKDFFL